jgi:hypothetical protein
MNEMKTPQTKTTHPPKRRGYRLWLGCFTFTLVMPFLLYYGYCWGLLGRHILLLQYLFQCNCPTASELRYPKEVEIIIPGCTKTGVILSPGGHLLYVREQNKEHVSTYLLDLQTREKIPFNSPEVGNFSFLTDNLLYISLSYSEMYILNWPTGEQYSIYRYTHLYPNASVNGDADPSLLAEALQTAKYVFLIDQDDTVVALEADFPVSSSNNFVLGRFDLEGFDTDRVEQFLRSNNIVYQTILPYSPDEVLSPDRRFVARPDGIYLLDTGQKIVEGYSASNSIRGYSGKHFTARGWTDDGRAVIYSDFLNACLIEITFIGMDGYTCYIEVPQPVVKIAVPDEYLQPTQSP